jgi:O-antigen ligase
VCLVFLAVSKVAAMERGDRALLIGLILGLSVQACYAIWARANGALQTGGSLGHQNLLGFISHMALMPAFALLLSGKMPRWALLGVGAGLTVVILTASRATIAIAGCALVLTLVLSISVRFTPRKAAVAVAGVFLLAASYPLAYATLERRFAVQNTTFLAEDKERVAFEKAARAMISANPLGVGPNHYVFIANTEGYSERAGVNWNVGSRSTQVHNTYLLVTAETGLLGLLTLALLLGIAIFSALGGAMRFRMQAGSELLIGLGVGVVAVVAHGLVEWVFVASATQYVLAGSLGLITGLRSRFLSQQKVTAKNRRNARPSEIVPPTRESLGMA